MQSQTLQRTERAAKNGKQFLCQHVKQISPVIWDILLNYIILLGGEGESKKLKER